MCYSTSTSFSCANLALAISWKGPVCGEPMLAAAVTHTREDFLRLFAVRQCLHDFVSVAEDQENLPHVPGGAADIYKRIVYR